MSICNEKYFEQQRLRVLKNYSKSKHKGFADENDFADWFVSQLKDHHCNCYYCETSIHDIVRLIAAGLLKERQIGNGWRGKILEIDKNDASYTKEECVLACYYCNNDKSYITSKQDYKEHFGYNRKKYFAALVGQLEAKVNPESYPIHHES